MSNAPGLLWSVLVCGGRICTSGIRPGYGLVRGWRPGCALLSEGHSGPRRSCRAGSARFRVTNVAVAGRFVAFGGRVGRVEVTNLALPGTFVVFRAAGGALPLTRHASVEETQPVVVKLDARGRSARSAPTKQRGRVWSGAHVVSAHRRQPVLIGPVSGAAPVCQARPDRAAKPSRSDRLDRRADVSARSNRAEGADAGGEARPHGERDGDGEARRSAVRGKRPKPPFGSAALRQSRAQGEAPREPACARRACRAR